MAEYRIAVLRHSKMAKVRFDADRRGDLFTRIDRNVDSSSDKTGRQSRVSKYSIGGYYGQTLAKTRVFGRVFVPRAKGEKIGELWIIEVGESDNVISSFLIRRLKF